MCGSRSVAIWMDDGKPTRYVRCQGCSTVYASPCAPLSVRHAGLDTTFSYGENAIRNAEARRKALRTEAELIKRYIAGGRMLDVGCSLGDLFAGFPDPAWERFGVELSPSAAAHATRTHAARVQAGTLLKAGYPADFFDLVTLIDMMYYLDDPGAEFREISRVMKPGGILAVEIPGQAFMLWRSRGLLCWLMERQWTRLRTDSAYVLWPTPLGLRRFLTRIGFQAVGWHVISSPKQSGRLQRILSQTYFRLSSAAARSFPRTLTFAPRYLFLARKEPQSARV